MGVGVRLFGPVRIERDGACLFPAGQARAVLALLALQEPRPVSAGDLIDALWPAGPPPSARVQVQGLVSGLRRTMRCGRCCTGSCPIQTGPAGYVLALSPDQLDVHRFRVSAAGGTVALARGRVAEAAAQFGAALGHWTAPPCQDLDLPAVADLLRPLTMAHADAVEGWAEASLALGEGAALAGPLYRAVGEHPFRERLRGFLMQALCRAGRVAEALAVYEQGRRMLAEELGADPSPALRDLHLAVLTGELDGAGRRPEPAAGPRSLEAAWSRSRS